MRNNADPPRRRGHGEVPTDRQREVIQVIDAYRRENGCPPSNRDILERARLSSLSTVCLDLRKLRAARLVRYEDRRSRTVTVTRAGLRAIRPAPQARNTSGGARRGVGQPQRAARREKIAWVPLVGRIAAGAPILAEQSIEGYWPLPEEIVGAGEGLFMLRVVGDSMTGAGIFPGNLVVIRPLFEDPHNGDIVAAAVDGMELEGTVKTYRKTGQQVWLMPHNPAYTPIPVEKPEFFGKVIAVLRQV